MSFSIQKLKKDEYQRRELYNVFYGFTENTQSAWQIMRTCKPCKKKAQEAGLGTDEVDAEKMELLINGFQCFINAIDEAKKQIDELGYGVDDNFDLKAYQSDCMAYFEREREKAMKEKNLQTENSEWQNTLNSIVTKYNEAMNKEIQRVKKEMGI